MLPFSINTFLSFTQALSTLRRVLVARWTPWFIASSKLCSEVALNSVTRAIGIDDPPFLDFLLLRKDLPSLLWSVNTRPGGSSGTVVARPADSIAARLGPEWDSDL